MVRNKDRFQMDHNFRLHIKTDLKRFILLDRITGVTNHSIAAEKKFTHAPAFLGMEALAQLGAYHVRFQSHFEKHAFLLKIMKCPVCMDESLNGRYQLEGTLLSHSAGACCYKLNGHRIDAPLSGTSGPATLSGEFLIATIAYDDHFQKDILQHHYRKAFSCLQHV